jgi:phage shock protein PspC (stress-responsive transcriptional regulator)
MFPNNAWDVAGLVILATFFCLVLLGIVAALIAVLIVPWRSRRRGLAPGVRERP